ncbi:MAG: dihydrofolate reductase, partial [Muribaculaceae bacterium]|nr:dihydrofolate reductase [Muribaculaceae bacterium]
MTISIIVAVARHNAIGRNGDLLFHIREDLRHFKAVTLGHPVIMGRKPFESLPGGPLPGRE